VGAVLVVNAGSTSLKLSVVGDDGRPPRSNRSTPRLRRSTRSRTGSSTAARASASLWSSTTRSSES
jgi:hypothetical protein